MTQNPVLGGANQYLLTGLCAREREIANASSFLRRNEKGPVRKWKVE
jgi:hypothetical protein